MCIDIMSQPWIKSSFLNYVILGKILKFKLEPIIQLFNYFSDTNILFHCCP